MSEPLITDIKQTKMVQHQQHQPGTVPESVYFIDGNKNKGDVMTQISSEGHLNYSDYEKMDLPTQQDILLSTLSNFLVEPPLSLPMTLGLYSRWGSGKSSYVNRLVEFLAEYKQQERYQPVTISFLLTMVCFIIGVNFGLIASAVAGQKAGSICGMCAGIGLFTLFLFCRLSITSSNNNMRNFAIKFTIFFHRFIIFLKMVYCLPPQSEELRSVLPVNTIMVDFSEQAVKAEDPITLFVDFVKTLNDAVEKDLGIFIPRLYRIFQGAKHYKSRMGRDFYSHWKTSCCCIPSFVITVFIFLCLWVAIILYNIYDLPGPITVMAVQIACCCVFGGGLISYVFRTFLMTYCMFLPMKKRIEIVANRAGIHEDTFISILKHEIDLYVDMVECIDGFDHRQTRIIVNLDLVDTLEQQKVLNIINSISLLLTEPGYPFILVLSVDPRLLIRAIDQTLSNIQEPVLSPCEYLKNMVDLPCYINEYPKLRTERVIPTDVREQIEEKIEMSENEDEEIEWDNSEDLLSGNSNMSEMTNGHVPLGDGTTSLQRSVKFPSDQSLTSADIQLIDEQDEEGSISEDISHLLRNNENNSLKDVKRIMNIVSLKGRILRYQDINFQWTRLTIWVSFCDGWPYKASWLTLVCLDPSLDIPGHMTIRKLNNIFGYLMPVIGDRHLGLDNSNTYFETFISSHKAMVTVTDIRSFAAFIFYIDPTIRKLMIDFLLSRRMKEESTKPPAVSTRSSQLWMNAVNPELLIRMSVEDVVNQLLQIEGLNESLLQQYKACLLENNINGRVLMACDLNDLRDVMKMKFGDWQLFRAWIAASRSKDKPVVTAAHEEKKTIEQPTVNSDVDQQSETNSKAPKLTSGTPKNTRGKPRPKADKKQPYASHLTPQYKRKALKDMKTSVSQDSDSSSPQHLINDNVLHHTSIDSGFASTEVDQNHRLMLNLQRRSCVPEFEEPPLPQSDNTHSIKVQRQTCVSEFEKPPLPKSENTQLIKVGWEGRNSDLIDIHMVDSIPTSNTLEYDNANDISVTQSIINEPPLVTYENELSENNTSIVDSNNKNEILDKSNDSINENILVPLDDSPRPPSLSEVPLPPISMLDESAPWPMSPPAEFDDNHEDQEFPSPTITSEQSQLNHNTNNIYYEDFSRNCDDTIILNTHKKSSAMSEPYAIDYSSGKRPSLKKSASVGYYDYERKPKFNMSKSTLDRGFLHDQEE